MASQCDIYQKVTDTIIQAIEAGQSGEQWRMPWHGCSVVPVNAHTGNHYRGINIPVLWAYQQELGHQSGTWASYKKWQAIGAQVMSHFLGYGGFLERLRAAIDPLSNQCYFGPR